jgi:transcriptional regulator with XRE-family HTH domain
MYQSNILSEILYKKRMSYRDLSRLSGVSKTAINKIANFESDPKQSTMVAIARALDMDVTEIFNLDWRR